MSKKRSSDDKDPIEKAARVDKTLQWLRISRDSWKEKTQESKAKLKIATLGLKRAREARDETEKMSQEQLCNIQKQLAQKDAEIALLKNKLEHTTQELDVLKKKR